MRTVYHWTLICCLLVACGGDDDDDDDNGGSAVVGSCHGMCGAQYQDCPNEIETCRQVCDVVAPALTAECEGSARAYYDCGAQVEWSCQGLLSNQVDQSQCQTERDAYYDCL